MGTAAPPDSQNARSSVDVPTVLVEMKIPDWLKEQMAGTGVFFRAYISIILCLVAGGVAWTTLTGETDLAVAYPMFALISSLLLGLGLLRIGDWNVAALSGTAVAVVGSSIWMTAVLKSNLETGTWERATAFLLIASMVAVVAVMGAFGRLARVMRHRRPRTKGTAAFWLLAMAAVPMTLVVYSVALIFLTGVELPLEHP